MVNSDNRLVAESCGDDHGHDVPDARFDLITLIWSVAIHVMVKIKMTMMTIEDEYNIAEAGVTRAFCVGGRTSTSGAVALSRTLVSSWSGYCHHLRRPGGDIIIGVIPTMITPSSSNHLNVFYAIFCINCASVEFSKILLSSHSVIHTEDALFTISAQ